MHTADLSPFTEAERWALVRDGHAIVTAGIICTIDELPGPGLRLNATLETQFSGAGHFDAKQNDAVAIQQSALWVLGATSAPPRQVCLAGLDGTRLYVGRGKAQVRELNISRADCLSFGNRLVTTPERTAADIARHSPDDDMAMQDLTDLAQLPGFASAQALAILARTVHLPFARRARQRLAAALAHAVDVVDAINSPNGIEEPIEVAGVAHLKNKSIQG